MDYLFKVIDEDKEQYRLISDELSEIYAGKDDYDDVDLNEENTALCSLGQIDQEIELLKRLKDRMDLYNRNILEPYTLQIKVDNSDDKLQFYFFIVDNYLQDEDHPFLSGDYSQAITYMDNLLAEMDLCYDDIF